MRSPHLALLATGLLLVAAPALTAAASPDPLDPPETSPVGTTWRLTAARLSGAFGDIPDTVLVTLLLDEAGQASGTGGCNRYFAGYFMDGATLSFGPVGSTKMACPEPQMSIESFFFADLASVAGWSTEGTTLRLHEAAGEVVLAFEPTASEADIQGIDWQLAQLVMDAVLTDVPADVFATLRIEAGQVGGSAGCNAYGGPATIDGTSITFGALMMTEMACDEPRSSVEAAFMIALALVTSYQSDGASLSLLDAAGTVQLVFTIPGAIEVPPAG